MYLTAPEYIPIVLRCDGLTKFTGTLIRALPKEGFGTNCPRNPPEIGG